MVSSSLRLAVLSSVALGSFASFEPSDAGTKPNRGPAIVGAIRWDAYLATYYI